ncbi:MAG: hypothetical protein AAGB46_18740, partial [Verrucomicrobiota bacterium]
MREIDFEIASAIIDRVKRSKIASTFTRSYPKTSALRACIFCLLPVSSMLGWLNAGEPFAPLKVEPMTELWRWAQFNPKVDREFTCGDTDREGNAWLASFDAVVFYNGQEATVFPFPAEPRFKRKSKDVHLAKNGSLYLLKEEVLAVLGPDRQWRALLDVTENSRISTSITETADGTIWVGLESGLYKISRGEARRIPGEFDSVATLIADDRNHLWCIGNEPRELAVYAVEGENAELRTTQRKIISSFPEKGPAHFLKRSDGEIWAHAIGRQRRHIAYEFEKGIKERYITLPSVLDPNRFTSLSAGPSDDSLIAIQLPYICIFKEGRWSSIHLKDYPIPTRYPFVIQLANERIMLSAWRSKSVTVDLSENRWLTYENLIFCDDDAMGRAWFLHKDKRAIVHDYSTGKWTAYSAQDGVIDSPNSILCDEEGIVWISGSHQNHAAVSYYRDGQWNLQTFPNIGHTFSHLSVC